MGGSSTDIEALLADVTDPANPTPGMLPAIFRDIVGALEAEGYPYAVVGRIALTLHEQARYVGAIEIVADFSAGGPECAAGLAQATRGRFAAHMDPRLCPRPIELTLRPCICATEAGLLAETNHPLLVRCSSATGQRGTPALALVPLGRRRSSS